MCEGASKQTPDLKILPRRDRAPRFEIPGSATDYIVNVAINLSSYLYSVISGTGAGRHGFVLYTCNRAWCAFTHSILIPSLSLLVGFFMNVCSEDYQ